MLTAFSLFSDPRRSTTRTACRPRRRCRPSGSIETSSPSSAPLRSSIGRKYSAEAFFLSTGCTRVPLSRPSADDAEQPHAGFRQDLDHPSREGRLVATGIRCGFDPQQRPVSDAGHRMAGPRLFRHMHQDPRHGTVLLLVPIGRLCDQLAVAVAAHDVGNRHGGQGTGPHGASPLLDLSFGLEFAQHALQFDPVVTLDPESARDLALADFAERPLAVGERFFLAGHEGQDVGFARQCGRCHLLGFRHLD